MGLALEGVRTVTFNAANLGAAMLGALEVGVCSSVAGQTAGVNFGRRSLLKEEDFGFIAAPGDMVRPRSMTAFATLFRRAACLIQRGFPVRRFLPAAVNFFVAGL